MTAPREIIELVERFDRNRDVYRSPSYNETQLRREFLDPFFAALGWDVDNRAGWAEAYKEVIHEDAIKIGGFTKVPPFRGDDPPSERRPRHPGGDPDPAVLNRTSRIAETSTESRDLNVVSNDLMIGIM